MRRRRPITWQEHLSRDARRHLHIAHLMIRAGETVVALEALAIACDALTRVASLRAGRS